MCLPPPASERPLACSKFSTSHASAEARRQKASPKWKIPGFHVQQHKRLASSKGKEQCPRAGHAPVPHAGAVHPRRCPGTRDALAASGARRTLTAYTLYEALMRAVSADGDADVAGEMAPIEGLDRAVTPAALLGGQEPSAPEEHLWFRERTRCACLACRAQGAPVVSRAHQVRLFSMPSPRSTCGSASAAGAAVQQAPPPGRAPPAQRGGA